jgi:hypothetical protein
MRVKQIIAFLIVLVFLFPDVGTAISKRKTARSRVLTVQKKMAEIKVPKGKEAVKFEMVAFDYNIKDEESVWKIVDGEGTVYFSCEVVDRMSGTLKKSGDLAELTLDPGVYTLELITQNGVVELKYDLEKK